MRSTFLSLVAVAGLATMAALAEPQAPAQNDAPDQFYDSHFHLTNYIQQGISPQDFLKIMGTRVGRSTMFGICLLYTSPSPRDRSVSRMPSSA